MVKRLLIGITVLSSLVGGPATKSAADGIPQQLQQIQQALQTIQTTLGTQGTGLSSLTQQLQTLQTTANSIKNSLATVGKPRKFYLTGNPVDGAAASGACSTGYHMASLWEIFDPSRLDYNTSLGMTLEDSAQGPPSFFIGWIRTGAGTGIGNEQDNGTTPGTRSCGAYTTNANDQHGVVVNLSNDWGSSHGGIDPWVPAAQTCDQKAFVWCVENQ